MYPSPINSISVSRHINILLHSPLQIDIRDGGITITRAKIGHSRLSHDAFTSSIKNQQQYVCDTCNETLKIEHIIQWSTAPNTEKSTKSLSASKYVSIAIMFQSNDIHKSEIFIYIHVYIIFYVI